jgi:hypothetical protein
MTLAESQIPCAHSGAFLFNEDRGSGQSSVEDRRMNVRSLGLLNDAN